MTINLVGYVSVRVFAHATEDVDKVIQAAMKLFPGKTVEELPFKRTKLTGHHGNPIVLLELKIKDRENVKAFIEKLSNELTVLDKEFLSTHFEQHTKKGSFYLRLDKQSAYKGKLKLGSADPIHLRIGFKTGKTAEMKKTFKELGVLL